MTASTIKFSNKTILLSGLLVGTLDILSAFVDVYIATGKNPVVVLNYISRGVFGKTDFTSTDTAALLGLLFHYIIAFAFTLFFFWLYARMEWMRKNWFVSGVVYGIFTWVVMNLIVVRLSNIPTAALSAMQPMKVLKSALILIFMIGLPLSLIANLASRKNSSSR
jgi:uncharacterized protein YacL